MSVLGANLAEYINNLGWWAIIDLLVFVAVSVLILLFFKKRNSLKLAVMLALYILLLVGVSVAQAMVGKSFLYITKLILEVAGIFIIAALVVVYQSDFKVIFSRLARSNDKTNKYDYDSTDEEMLDSAGEIVKACQNMAKNDVGALIIIARTNVPSHILDTGTELEAKVSSGLIESIFSTKGPLHDGAVVIKNGRVLAAGCFLPLSQEVDIAKELGTRHRAAIGITEESDVFAIVVSEETGVISTVEGGKIKRYMTPEKLLEQIKIAYGISAELIRKDKKKERNFL